MTEKEKRMKKYVNAIERRLNLPYAVKARVMSDFSSSITARREAGMSDEEIYREFGTPRKAAADLNEQMKEYAYRKSPWRFVFLAAALFGAWELLGGIVSVLIFWLFQLQMHRKAASIGIIGGADGPTAIFVTTPDWVHWLVPVILLLVGGFGFLRLRKCRQK